MGVYRIQPFEYLGDNIFPVLPSEAPNISVLAPWARKRSGEGLVYALSSPKVTEKNYIN